MPTKEGVSGPTSGVSNCFIFKSRLQEYVQKLGYSTPAYDTSKEGPSHEPYFQTTVTVNNIKYESLPGFSNRKPSEQSAAEVALLELAKSGALDDISISQPVQETGLCKNLLQEYSQKMNYAVPTYQCQKDEKQGRAAQFTCTIEIGGIKYIGGMARTKKGAEIKAARTAILAIQLGNSELYGEQHGSSKLTVLPSRKRAPEPANHSDETAKPPKAKKARIRKRGSKSKSKLSGQKPNLEQVGNNAHLGKDHPIGLTLDQTYASREAPDVEMSSLVYSEANKLHVPDVGMSSLGCPEVNKLQVPEFSENSTVNNSTQHPPLEHLPKAPEMTTLVNNSSLDHSLMATEVKDVHVPRVSEMSTPVNNSSTQDPSLVATEVNEVHVAKVTEIATPVNNTTHDPPLVATEVNDVADVANVANVAKVSETDLVNNSTHDPPLLGTEVNEVHVAKVSETDLVSNTTHDPPLVGTEVNEVHVAKVSETDVVNNSTQDPPLVSIEVNTVEVPKVSEMEVPVVPKVSETASLVDNSTLDQIEAATCMNELNQSITQA